MNSEPVPLNVPTGISEHLRGASRTVVQSLLNILGRAGDSDVRRLEAVRVEVLAALETAGANGTSLETRVRHCTDLEEMWYLRPQLNAALVAGLGHARAELALQRITVLFAGAGFPVPASGPRRKRA